MVTTRVIFFTVLLCGNGQSVQGRNGTMDDWIRLTNNLFSNYTGGIYPVNNFSDYLTLETAMFVLSIVDFDEVSSVITLNGGILLRWVDFRLAWNPNDYGGIENIIVKSSLMWKPNVYLITTAEDMVSFNSDQFDVRLHYNGSCYYAPGKQMRATCSVDMSQFPLDSHTCKLVLSQWSMDIDEVQMNYVRTDCIMDYYKPDGEWELTKTSVYASTQLSNAVTFSIDLKRKPVYFTLSLIIPIVLLCFLDPFVFLLPASSGRVSYTITMFLSLAVYMTLIGDSLPKVSENMARMSYFLLLTLIYSSALILLTIFTLRCEAVTDVNKFPSCLKRLTLCCFKKRKNRVIGVENKEGNEKGDFDEEIQKEDVMRFINIFLFVTSLLFMLIVAISFFLSLFI